MDQHATLHQTARAQLWGPQMLFKQGASLGVEMAEGTTQWRHWDMPSYANGIHHLMYAKAQLVPSGDGLARPRLWCSLSPFPTPPHNGRHGRAPFPAPATSFPFRVAPFKQPPGPATLAASSSLERALVRVHVAVHCNVDAELVQQRFCKGGRRHGEIIGCGVCRDGDRPRTAS